MSKAGIALTAIIGVIVIVVISVGGYLGGWWLKEDAVNRTTDIDQNSLSVQSTARTVISDTAAEVAKLETLVVTDPTNAAVYTSQINAISRRGCDRVIVIRGPVSTDIADFAFTYCNVTLEVN